MQMNLKDYVRVYKNVYDKSFCENVIAELQDVEFIKHQFYGATDNNYVYVGDDFDCFQGNIHSKKIIMDTTWKMIHKYIVEEFNFPWFTGWSAFTPTKFHRYDVNTNMKEHCDHIHSIFDGQLKGVPILSVLSSLNEDYEGGDLIFFENEKIDLKTGDVMIFPSNFMYPHKVTPVTKGQRYSMVNWVW